MEVLCIITCIATISCLPQGPGLEPRCPHPTKVCGGWWTDTNIYAKRFDFDIVFLKNPLTSLLDRFYLAFGFWKLFICESRTISEED